MAKSARKFAQAVFELALDRNELDRWMESTEAIAEAFSDPEVGAVLSSPSIRFSEKERFLATLLPDLSPLAGNLAKLLVQKGRVGQARDLAQEYRRLLDLHRHIERAEASTAVPLSPEEQENLRKNLEGMVGRQVVLTVLQDPTIIGGLVVKVSGRIIDGSIETRLGELKSILVEGRV